MNAPVRHMPDDRCRLFVHSFDAPAMGLQRTDPRLVGLEHRAFCLAEATDAVVVASEPDADWLATLPASAGRASVIYLGTSDPHDTLCARLLACPASLDRARTFLADGTETRGAISVYMGGSDEDRLARELGTPVLAGDADVTAWANRKTALREILTDAGLETIPGETADTSEVSRTVQAMAAAYPGRGVVVRADRSTAGSGVWMLDPGTGADGWHPPAGALDASTRVLVEPRLWVRSSPNAQYLLTDDTCRPLGITDQRLGEDGRSHRGNRAPPEPDTIDEVERVARAAAETIRARGVRGVVGIDLIVCPPDDPLAPPGRCVVVEINARVNTSTFGLVLLERVLGAEWMNGLEAVIVPGVACPRCASFRQLVERLASAEAINNCQSLPDLMPGLPRGVAVTRPPRSDRRSADLVVVAPPDEAESRLTRITEHLTGTG